MPPPLTQLRALQLRTESLSSANVATMQILTLGGELGPTYLHVRGSELTEQFQATLRDQETLQADGILL